MAKQRKLRSSIFEDNTNALKSNVEAAEEIVSKATKPQSSTKRSQRIKFTTVISPYHRACLEFLAKQQKVSMADLLDLIIGDYVKDNQLIEENKELLAAFEMIYNSKK
jgi:hypothetical protein